MPRCIQFAGRGWLAQRIHEFSQEGGQIPKSEVWTWGGGQVNLKSWIVPCFPFLLKTDRSRKNMLERGGSDPKHRSVTLGWRGADNFCCPKCVIVWDHFVEDCFMLWRKIWRSCGVAVREMGTWILGFPEIPVKQEPFQCWRWDWRTSRYPTPEKFSKSHTYIKPKPQNSLLTEPPMTSTEPFLPVYTQVQNRLQTPKTEGVEAFESFTDA